MRIGVVNDMTMAVEAIRRVVISTPGHELAWVAQDGLEAVALCSQDRPDLVLMDLIMPQMDGIEATRRIMQKSPCPILIVTADVDRNSAKVFQAMGAGALDAIDTPTLGNDGGTGGLLAKMQTINRLVARSKLSLNAPGESIAEQAFPLIAIGASAGGPSALANILSEFPAHFPAAVVIVQHTDFHFAAGLADWLKSQTKMKLRLARDGDAPTLGTILLAGSENHLVFVSPGKLGYVASPHTTAFRPSIDIFFHSIQHSGSREVMGVLLTGMGRDGAEGLKSLRDAGHFTIAQDRATSAIYGMPKAALGLKAASEVLPIDQIGPRLRRRVNERSTIHGNV
ncbi:chemotaxis response regulator protein-glutamate methylesterase [Pedosphaera parvula]|uniref:Protein-glutamate methylesterase/protein-glutamine glutaminase n=1 Tax=Pedosphaera parvula (strain Ellin514) TaxID=320771 RepID=B9XNN2_PEDPL|nr:chemotaxis response regulator protein-glutamate methylesterase [Pedosphaera parvula]EEF58572.1 response regulator receiver modulated CheB methylesterase [Pedosphaera parvula Ellin514]